MIGKSADHLSPVWIEQMEFNPESKGYWTLSCCCVL